MENSTSHKASLVICGNPLQSAADYVSTWCEDNSMLLNVSIATLQKRIVGDPIK